MRANPYQHLLFPRFFPSFAFISRLYDNPTAFETTCHLSAGSRWCNLAAYCANTSWTPGRPMCPRPITRGPALVLGRYRHYWPFYQEALRLLWRSYWPKLLSAGGRNKFSNETHGQDISASSCKHNTCSSGFNGRGKWIFLCLLQFDAKASLF